MLKISKAICWLRRGIKWVESLIDDDLKEKEIFYDSSQKKKETESVTEVKKTENNCAINHELQFFPASFCLLCTRYIHGMKFIRHIYKQFFVPSSFFLLSSALPAL